MIIAAFESVGFAVAGVHAWRLLTSKSAKLFHQKGMIIALIFASVAAIIQPVSGDLLAKLTAQIQPLKLAAMEAHYETQQQAPLLLGGIVNEQEEKISYAIEIPQLLSFLAYDDTQATVKGIKDFPKDERPPIAPVRYSFEIMVILGTILAGIGALFLLLFFFRKNLLTNNLFLKLIIFSIPLGFISIEAGWTVTEVGRQPWIIYGIMKTKDALTPMPGVFYTFLGVTLLYLFLSFFAVWLLYRQILKIERTETIGVEKNA